MKTKFDIGEWVEAEANVYFNYGYKDEKETGSPNKREMFRQEVSGRRAKKKGRIVGMSYRNIGIVKRGYYDEPNTFTTTKRVLVYLIKEGMINKPFNCLPEDLKRIPAEEFPFCKSHKAWTKEMRKALSEDSKEFPRDEIGRFI